MKYKTVEAQLQCSVCNNIEVIRRRIHRQKKEGHIKHMYCYKCKEVTAHIEIKENL